MRGDARDRRVAAGRVDILDGNAAALMAEHHQADPSCSR
jgi:hypothetical protein